MGTRQNPDLSVENYTAAGLDLMVIKEKRWTKVVVSRVPSKSGGEEHFVKIYRKNVTCTCKALEHGKLCWAVKKVALIADDNGFWS